MSDLRERLVSGIALGAAFAFAAWFGGFVFLALLCIGACVIWSEWCGIRMPDIDDRLMLLGTVAIVFIAINLWLLSGFVEWFAVLAIAAVFSALCAGMGQPRAIKGFFYSVALLVAAGHLRGEGDNWPGFIGICFLCAIVFSTDIGAYFVGRKIGGPKLSPRISPNKTMSGAIGGLFAATLAASLTYSAFGLGPLWAAVALAVPLSIVSQAGDLYESSMKRNAGVKDSGRIIPGHGGVMDRVDGLLFAAFGLWLLSVMSGEWNTPALAFFAR